jgi:predicted XRE-type DNA-binding protein
VKRESNKPSYVTKGDVLDDLGFSRSEASALKVKAQLLDAILSEIVKQGLTQAQLVEILDEYQPSVSNLVRGKIASISLEKLLAYSDRLKLTAVLTVRRGGQTRGRSPQAAKNRNGSRNNSRRVAAG